MQTKRQSGKGKAMRIQIRDHLILPFGTARKFDLQRIKLSSVAANGIYLNSDIPCVYINVAAKEPLTMEDFDIFILGERGHELEQDEDVTVGLDYIHRLILKHMPPDTTTKYETMFLDLYFDYLK
jgi:hypothetical protein